MSTWVQLVVVVVLTLLGFSHCLLTENLVKKNCSSSLNTSVELSLSQEGQGLSCPPWFTSEAGECRPGPTLGGIIQQDLLTLQTSLLLCHCMSEVNGALVVGACMYTCKAVMGYYPLPCHVSQLQNFTCGDLHRRGELCGQCEDGYAIPVYSYDLACVRCENYKYNWLKYVAVAFLPLTLFYILVCLFSISFTSPAVSGFVTVYQIGAHPMQLQIFLSLAKSGNLLAPRALKVLLSLAALFNLDYFRLYYSFCLHPDASAMTIMALDYATTVYPVILIGVTYVMVQLYDHNFKLLVWPWKLLSVILKPLRKHWNVKTSLVDVFASFIYLSSTRLLVTSMNFLVPLTTYTYHQGTDGHMKLTTSYYLFNSPSVQYFGREHLPFALLALTLTLLFFALPMALLFVYPSSYFQRVLNKCGLNSLILRTFVEVFQGPFKDGTNSARDCRYFSGFLLLFQLLENLTFLLTQSSFYYPIAGIWILIYLVLHLLCLPYKRPAHNYVTISMLLSLVGFYYGISVSTGIVAVQRGSFNDRYVYNFEGVWLVSTVISAVSICVPLVYLFGSVLLLLVKKVVVNIFQQFS